MSSPQPLPLILNVLAVLLGLLIKCWHWARAILCGCISTGRTRLEAEERRAKLQRLNIRYLADFSATNDDDDEEQTQPFLRNWSGVRKSTDSTAKQQDGKKDDCAGGTEWDFRRSLVKKIDDKTTTHGIFISRPFHERYKCFRKNSRMV